jgi:hypothetical protein
MLAILRNTLYMCVFQAYSAFPARSTGGQTSYGGIFERGSREYTLDDFHSLQLDKMDRFVCLKQSDVLIPEGEESSSSDDEDDSGDSDDDSEEDDLEQETLVDPDEEMAFAESKSKELVIEEEEWEDGGEQEQEQEQEQRQEEEKEEKVCENIIC